MLKRLDEIAAARGIPRHQVMREAFELLIRMEDERAGKGGENPQRELGVSQ